MVKAIARAFRWREMLENREYATIREIAAAEKINETYVGACAAPDPAGAGHRRDDLERAAAGGTATEWPHNAFSGGAAGPV